jgi:hypothetical protein
LVQKLIAEGAVDLVVPGVLPIGCFPMYLSIFRKEQPEMYGPRSGCIKDLNTLSWVHNALLAAAEEDHRAPEKTPRRAHRLRRLLHRRHAVRPPRREVR